MREKNEVERTGVIHRCVVEWWGIKGSLVKALGGEIKTTNPKTKGGKFTRGLYNAH